MLFLLFCKTLLVRLRRHTCSNFHNDTKTLLYLTFVRSHLNMIMLVRSGLLSQLEIFRKMRVSEKDLSNQIYFELAWMGRIPPQYHENLTKLGFQAPGFQLFLIVDYVHEINDLLFYFRCRLGHYSIYLQNFQYSFLRGISLVSRDSSQSYLTCLSIPKSCMHQIVSN